MSKPVAPEGYVVGPLSGGGGGGGGGCVVVVGTSRPCTLVTVCEMVAFAWSRTLLTAAVAGWSAGTFGSVVGGSLGSVVGGTVSGGTGGTGGAVWMLGFGNVTSTTAGVPRPTTTRRPPAVEGSVAATAGVPPSIAASTARSSTEIVHGGPSVSTR